MAQYPTTPYSMFDTLKIRNNEYTGMYRGTVLDNEDPEGRGRCKVYVYGVYDEKFKEEKGQYLPWAEPSQPLFCGGHGKNGTFQCPDMDATVWVFFESGDITRPIMFGQTTDEASKSVDKTHGSALTQFSTDYCTMYWEGMYVEMRKSTHTVTVSSENIDATASNNLSGHADNDAFIDVDNNMTLYAKNDITIKADNNIMMEAASNITMKAGTAIDGTAGAAVTFKAPNATLDGSSHMTGSATIEGSTTINAVTTINADANIGGKSFLGHIHGNGNMGTPTTPPM